MRIDKASKAAQTCPEATLDMDGVKSTAKFAALDASVPGATASAAYTLSMSRDGGEAFTFSSVTARDRNNLVQSLEVAEKLDTTKSVEIAGAFVKPFAELP